MLRSLLVRSSRAAVALTVLTRAASGQAPRPLLPIDHTRSAEYAWLGKKVHASRVLDDMTNPAAWRFSGDGRLTFPTELRLSDMRAARVEMTLFTTPPTPGRNRLPTVALRRAVANEDWRAYNRLSLWIRLDAAGFPTVPLQLTLHNNGAEKVPDKYGREGIHLITLEHDGWQHVVWEIDQFARDRVTGIDVSYWANKMLAAPGDRVAFEIARVELQRVDPDHHTGWDIAPGQIAFSGTGYEVGSTKTALANGLAARTFELVRVGDDALGTVVLRDSVRTVTTRLGTFQQLDFTRVTEPGDYVLRAGDVRTRPFRIARDVWVGTVWKTLNFFYGNRCGFSVPGSHDVDHRDWFAVHGDERVTMSGGWHDAGDLSQGVVNTGEAVYAMYALAERLEERRGDPALIARLLEEAAWGLDWTTRVRFSDGARVAFGSHNLWTDNVVGTADDRAVEAKVNPNASYISAAAEAIAYRVLKDRDPERAQHALRVAMDDWEHAVRGVESAATRHTPAFAATRVELASIGVTASVELYRATGERRYADTAVSLARVVVASQQPKPVGHAFPLGGFFWTGPERDTLFHQFHRGNDQAPIVALAQLVETFPNHADRKTWEGVVARFAEYQAQGATTTAPWGVLPAYVYREGDGAREVPDSGALHGATREAYEAQVRAGFPLGDGWHLRAFPVWFARRGNYGVLLSQAKALSTAARLRGDSALFALAQEQAQWVVGRNPFAQSTMYGEGYDWSQQYSVSSGDFVGSLPVGMQSRGDTDLPYWSGQNMFVYKEVWVHSSSRWLWLMADLLGGR